jgi:hypothetical protein
LLIAPAALLGCACAQGGSADPCRGQECSARGFCIAEQDQPYCACIPGFHPIGLACQANAPGNPCLGVDCSGFGVCRAVGDDPTCDCRPGYGHLPADDERCAVAECDLLCVPVDEDAAVDADADGDEVGAPDADADGDAPADEVGAADADADGDVPADEVGAGDADADADRADEGTAEDVRDDRGDTSECSVSEEVCNGRDDDCDGSTDEGGVCDCPCADGDLDGYYPTACTDPRCSPRTDCDDGDRDVHPGAVEYCDAADQDCDDLPYGATSPFTDVDESDGWFPYVYALYASGDIEGFADGTFRPYDELLRVHAAAFIARSFGLARLSPTDAFCDMGGDYPWFDDDVQALYDHDITDGRTAPCVVPPTCHETPAHFCPHDPTTRAELAVFVWRAIHGTLTCPSCPPSRTFCDSNHPATSWACGCIEDLETHGVVEGGMPGCAETTCSPPPAFCPSDHATRCHAVVMLARATAAALPCVEP